MTLQQTADRKLQPTDHSVPADRNTRIFRTCWIKTAGRSQERRDPIAVTGKQSQAPLAHASPHGYEAAFGGGATTAIPLSGQHRVEQSKPALGRPQGLVPGAIDRRTCRVSSRNRRFTRFRLTAPPNRFPTTIPTRLPLTSVRANHHVKEGGRDTTARASWHTRCRGCVSGTDPCHLHPATSPSS